MCGGKHQWKDHRRKIKEVGDRKAGYKGRRRPPLGPSPPRSVQPKPGRGRAWVLRLMEEPVGVS